VATKFSVGIIVSYLFASELDLLLKLFTLHKLTGDGDVFSLGLKMETQSDLYVWGIDDER